MKKYDQKRYGFTWEYPTLARSDQGKRKGLMRFPVRPLVPSRTHSVAALVRGMERMGVQARNLGSAYGVLRQMLTDRDHPIVILGLAGPLIAGGLRDVLREMVEFGLVDVVVSTGAIFYQDIYQARGHRHYLGSPAADDGELRRLYLNRIYDVYVDDMGFGATDSWIGMCADRMEPRPYSSRQFLENIADELRDPNSFVRACRRHGVPMFSPAINDSSIGIGITEHRHRAIKRSRPFMTIDSIADNYELAQIVAKAPATGAIFVAGGVPKNYINDSVVMSYMFGQKQEGHRYAIQMTTAVTADGGLSGSTLSEAKSWWKIGPTASTAMVWSEPTIVLPLLITAALEEGLCRKRRCHTFSWRGHILDRIDTSSRDRRKRSS